MAEVKLYGHPTSPFNYRVIWALKLKGIPYEHIIEDLSNKSSQLLQYNPVHKKIPVLVHQGKPICESMIIVEYIDAVWPENPLLPSDPYERAIARFWVQFFEEKVGKSIWRSFLSNGEEQETALKDSIEVLETVEKQCLGDKKFFGGNNINIVDIAYGCCSHWLEAMEESCGIKMIEAHKLPRLHAWVKNFKHVAVIKDNLPDLENLVGIYKSYREKLLP